MNERRKLFEARLAAGADSAMLRLSLGRMCFDDKDTEEAISHLRQAVKLDPDYSAAWALLGKAQAIGGSEAEALDAYRTGIDVADRKGDLQAARQMRVFLNRLEKAMGDKIAPFGG